MNVPIVFTESSPNVGGQEMQLMQQMAALQAEGTPCILACRPGGKVEAAARDRGLTTEAVAFRNSVHLPSILRLRGLLARTGARMLICHSGHDANNAAIAARLAPRRPFLLRSRTYLTGSQKAYSYNRLVDATMVPSHFIRDSLLADPQIRPDKIHVVYPGIDFERIDAAAQGEVPAPVRAWLARTSGPLLVHAAMLRAEKGHLPMLETVAALASSWPGLRYLIAGEGVEREVIEARVRALGLEAQVLLAGNVIPVHALYPLADLVVMPSLSEPLGMSQIEALSLGVPVVASRTGGIPETIHDGETGCLVEPGVVPAWVAALDAALADPQRMRAMAARGAEDVRSRFSVHSNLRQILDLLARSGRARGV